MTRKAKVNTVSWCRRGLAVICAALLMLAGVGPAGAATSGPVPDTDFNGRLGTGLDRSVETIAAAGQGGVLIGGPFTALDGDASIPDRLLRLNADGTPDTAFNARLGTGFSHGTIYAIAPTADGGFLVGGTFSEFNGDPSIPGRLIKLNGDGSLDTDFNDRLGTGFTNNVFDILPTDDGKFLIGGNMTSMNGDSSAPRGLVRLNADGSPDTAFNDRLGTGFDDIVRSMAILPDGTFLLGGRFTTLDGDASIPNSLVALRDDGSVSADFNPGLGTGFGYGLEEPHDFAIVDSVAVTADGGAVVGGEFLTLNGSSSIPQRLVRLDARGLPDRAFHDRLGSGFDDHVSVVHPTSTGDLLVGGWFTSVAGDASAPNGLARLNIDGSPDLTFRTHLGTGVDTSVDGILTDAVGGIVVVGWFGTINDDPATPRGLFRFAETTLTVGPLADRTDLVDTPIDMTVPYTINPAGSVLLSATGLPDGLALDPSTGDITGTPSTLGEFAVRVTATTITPSGPLSDTASFTWTIAAIPQPPTLTGDPGDGVVGSPYSSAFTVTGVPDPQVHATAGTLPPGLTLSPDGVLAGTPTTPGTFTFTATASNGIAPDAVLERTVRITDVIDLRLELQHAERAPGQTQVATADGFSPGEQVTFTLASTPVALGTITADDSGRARLTFSVPADASPGVHTVTATGVSGSAGATFTVAIAGPPAGGSDDGSALNPPAGGPLAVTGTSFAIWAATAAALGTVGVVLTRRRHGTP